MPGGGCYGLLGALLWCLQIDWCLVGKPVDWLVPSCLLYGLCMMVAHE